MAERSPWIPDEAAALDSAEPSSDRDDSQDWLPESLQGSATADLSPGVAELDSPASTDPDDVPPQAGDRVDSRLDAHEDDELISAIKEILLWARLAENRMQKLAEKNSELTGRIDELTEVVAKNAPTAESGSGPDHGHRPPSQPPRPPSQPPRPPSQPPRSRAAAKAAPIRSTVAGWVAKRKL